MITRIHVNQQILRRNHKTGERKAVITAKNSKTNRYANRMAIMDSKGKIVAEIIYSPDKPLNCGARCWIETKNKVKIIRNKKGN